MSDHSFTHDELEALLASRALAPDRQREGDVDSDEAIDDRDTEPSLDVQLLRDALREGLKQ